MQCFKNSYFNLYFPYKQFQQEKKVFNQTMRQKVIFDCKYLNATFVWST